MLPDYLLRPVLEAILKAHPRGTIAVYGPDLRYLHAGGGGLVGTGLAGGDLIGRLPTEVWAGELGECTDRNFRRCLSGWEGTEDVVCLERVYVVTSHPLRGEDGDIVAGITISVDVTEERANATQASASLAHANALLRELHHRVKNNLQVVQSLLSMTARRVDNTEARARLMDVRDRVHAMASVHSLLYRSGDLTAVRLDIYYRDLVHGLVKGLPNLGTVEVELDLEEVTAGADVAVNLALVLTELVSNAAKHGIRDGRGTRLRVSLAHRNGALFVAVEDDGPGAPMDVLLGSERGMGLWIARALVEPLGGRLDVSTDHGTRWTLVVDHPVDSA